ncbi:MAG: hypothetical protein HY537_18190 [Deltaproteobacteria bacterium]|nr:hypothetical protein [Deltaproteobacteria bacterium]
MELIAKGLLVCALASAFGAMAEPASKDEVNPVGNCNVRVMFKHNVQGGICPYLDEVMIGVVSLEPLTVRCGRLEAYCPRAASSSTAEKNDR